MILKMNLTFHIFSYYTYFSYIVAVTCIVGGNWSAWRKPLTCHITNKLNHIMRLYWAHLVWVGFELTLVVIGTDCTGTTIRSTPQRPPKVHRFSTKRFIFLSFLYVHHSSPMYNILTMGWVFLTFIIHLRQICGFPFIKFHVEHTSVVTSKH